MTILVATGFEMLGINPFKTANRTGTISIQSGGVGGTRYLQVFPGSASFPIPSQTSLYAAAHVEFNNASCLFNVGNINIRIVNNSWVVYRDSTVLATGTQFSYLDVWNHVQLYVEIDNTAGRVILVSEGRPDIDFTGNTGTTPITGVGTSVGNFRARMDNLIVRTDTWPGDVRFVSLLPNADTIQKDWTPDTGAVNFSRVNNTSDASFVRTATNGHKDLYELGDWSDTGLTSAVVVSWFRARKETANAQGVKMLLKSNTTEVASSKIILSTNYDGLEYAIFATDPHTTLPWESAGINALQIGQEYVD